MPVVRGLSMQRWVSPAFLLLASSMPDERAIWPRTAQSSSLSHASPPA